jgi:hypothetical protein
MFSCLVTERAREETRNPSQGLHHQRASCAQSPIRPSPRQHALSHKWRSISNNPATGLERQRDAEPVACTLHIVRRQHLPPSITSPIPSETRKHGGAASLLMGPYPHHRAPHRWEPHTSQAACDPLQVAGWGCLEISGFDCVTVLRKWDEILH